MKKKLSPVQLHIPEPCQESWDTMVPLPGGRYCGRCERIVLDFTQLTGRWRKWRAFGVLLSGLFLSGAAAAQPAQQKPPPIAQWAMGAPASFSEGSSSRIVEGFVTDEAGEPLIAATVSLNHPGKANPLIAGTITDVDGRFSLLIPAAPENLQLAFSYVGFESQSRDLGAEGARFDIQLKQASYELPGVIVAASAPIRVQCTLVGSAAICRSEVGQAGPASPDEEGEFAKVLKVYPNPFTSWLQLELQLEKPQTMLFHLYDASGKLVFTQAEALPQGRASLRLELGGRRLPAGMYFLRVSDEVGEVRTKGVEKALP